MTSLKPKALAKLERFPGCGRMRTGCASAAISTNSTTPTPPRCTASAIPRTTGLEHRASRGSAAVRVPHLVLNALNDPFVPAASLPGAGEVSRYVRLEHPPEGGHIGFARNPFPGRLDYIPQRLREFFTRGA